MGPYTLIAQNAVGKQIDRTKTSFIHLLDVEGKEMLKQPNVTQVIALNAIGETVLDSANGDFSDTVYDEDAKAPWAVILRPERFSKGAVLSGPIPTLKEASAEMRGLCASYPGRWLSIVEFSEADSQANERF